MSWQPSAPRDQLVARGRLNRSIRNFFDQRGVLEVETPLLGSSTATDPHLQSWSVTGSQQPLFLQTSPEFAMKRLLAAGSGPIYQLGKAFRKEACSRRHNPEFTMLEWYRPDWNLDQLLNEIEALVQCCGICFDRSLSSFPRMTYQQAFSNTLQLNPHTASDQELMECAQDHINGHFSDWDRNALLDLLMSHLVEPNLPKTGVFLTEFPASQCALAEVTPSAESGQPVAKRAELYLAGMEVANAYQELLDARQMVLRTKQDLAERSQHQLPDVPNPSHLLSAMEYGLPLSAGVALGVDRLLMALTNSDHINSVISFSFDRI